MFDMVELRNAEGEKINVRLDMNKTNYGRLGESFAQIRIGHEPYLLVAEQNDNPRLGDVEGRSWTLLHVGSIELPNSFFETENIGLLVQMIAPFLGEAKLKKVVEVLEADDE